MTKKDYKTLLKQQLEYNSLLKSLNDTRDEYNVAMKNIDECKINDLCNESDYPGTLLRLKHNKWFIFGLLFLVLLAILLFGALDWVKYYIPLIIVLVILCVFGIFLRGNDNRYIMLTNDIYQFDK